MKQQAGKSNCRVSARFGSRVRRRARQLDDARGHHISATCKMGPSDRPMAVVDQYGRVHGLQGLRVVDASIMSDYIRANTNVTTMMIGERIADLIGQGVSAILSYLLRNLTVFGMVFTVLDTGGSVV